MQYYTLDRVGNFYKGNLHTHTTVSDGELTPAQTKALYRQEGYSFIAITDHGVYGIHQDLNDPDFLIMPGIEVDTVYNDVIHHIVGVSASNSGFSHSELFPAAEFKGVDPQILIDHLVAHHNIAIYAHPFWSYTEMKDIGHLKNLMGMEIINYSCEQEWKSGIAEAHFEYFWRYGNKIWCFGSDDAHGHVPDYCGGYITVKCETLTHDAILSAIKRGSFYASYAHRGESAPQIFDFIVENGIAKISCSPCRNVYLNVSRSRYYPVHGTLDKPVMYAQCELPSQADHVKAICMDFQGHISWSQPIMLK